MVSRCLVLTVLVACGPVKGNLPDPDAPADSAEPGFQLAVLTSNVAVPLDGSATFEVAVTRTGGFTGDVTIGAVTPPNGLEVTAATVPGDADTFEIVVGALAPLAIGDEIDFNLEGTAAGVEAQTAAVTDAEITGRPGSLDVSFGVVGTGYAGIGFGNDDGGSFNAIDVLGGKIMATGEGIGGVSGPRFSTMRFTDTGAPDATFNSGARLITVFNPGSTNETTLSAGIGHQLDGRPILIGTHVGESPTVDLAVARLSTSGGPGGVDFGNQVDQGKSLIDLSGADEVVADGLVLADGRTVFVGQTLNHHMIALANASGTIDTSFNTTGFLRDVLGTSSIASKVAVDSDGNILVLGVSQGAADSDLTLHRYSTTGLDTTFGVGGRVLLTAAGTNEGAINLAVLASGKLIVGATSDGNYEVRRFNADGSADTSFGTGGVVQTPSVGTARDLIALPDGKILLLAQSNNDAVLVRFKADGTVDPLFGTDGVVNIPCGDSATINAFAVYDAHKIVIAGGNEGGVPGPGTKGLVVRIWM